MAGRAYQPRFLFMWPHARISVMGPEQAATVLTQIREESYSSQGKKWSKQDSEQYFEQIHQDYQDQSDAWYSTARLWDDGVINPLHTRQVLALSLKASCNKRWPETHYGVFRM